MEKIPATSYRFSTIKEELFSFIKDLEAEAKEISFSCVEYRINDTKEQSSSSLTSCVSFDAHKLWNSIGNSFGNTITQSWSECMLMNFSWISFTLQCVESECCRKKDVIDHGITDFSHKRARTEREKRSGQWTRRKNNVLCVVF